MEGFQRVPAAAAPVLLRGAVVGFSHEGRAGQPFPALGVHPGGRPGSPACADIPPVRSVRNNATGGVPGEVQGGRWDDGPHLGERWLPVAVPPFLEERYSARLGNRRQYLSDWRHVPRQPECGRALQPDRATDASRDLDATLRNADRLRGRSFAPGPRLCAVGAAGCEELTKSLRQRVVIGEELWVKEENGAEEEERSGEQVIHPRADP